MSRGLSCGGVMPGYYPAMRALLFVLLSVYAGTAAAAVADQPVPDVDTQIRVIEAQVEMTRIDWLDANTLAVGTYADDKAPDWTAQRVVAYDFAARGTRVLIPQGALRCANTDGGVLSAAVGDTRVYYRGDVRGAKPAETLFRWRNGVLQPADAELATANWNRLACLQTDAEDRDSIDWMFGRRPVRYLLKRHGQLRWPTVYQEQAQPLALHREGRSIPVALTNKDLGRLAVYRPWLDAYQLAIGGSVPGATPRDLPMLLMKPDGAVTRTPIPASLLEHLRGGYAEASALMFPVACGALVYSGEKFNPRRGLYLVNGNDARRIWCTPEQQARGSAYDDICRITTELAISPDGCKVAFGAKALFEPTVRIVQVCDGKR